MEAITISLVLLVAVVISGWLARLSPVPLPFVQIILGVVIASVTDFRVAPNPDLFFLLFLPPLLFLDGWRIPKESLFRDKETILALAIGLVFFTVLGLGIFLHWMIPTMPLAVAFALAAVLSPTDPVAVSAIAAKVSVPKRLMRILQGESLLNDASGLVAMRFAVAAALTGFFSFAEAAGTFLWLAIGGITVGVAVTWGITWTKGRLSRKLGEEAGTEILISLLIPFGAYLLAEHLRCSGILAAVAAGVSMSYAEQSGQAQAVTRVRRTAVWTTIEFAANGIIFVLLGEQFPGIAKAAAATTYRSGRSEVLWLVLYVLAINMVLATLRFFWVWAALQFTLFRAARRKEKMDRPSWRLIAATSLAGVRGAVTLAGISTLPLTLTDGSPFPDRDLAIYLAAGSILLSLLAASIGLPFLLKGLRLPPEPSFHEQEDAARVATARAAIKAIEELQHRLGVTKADTDLYAEAAVPIMEVYRRRIDSHSRTGEDAKRFRKIGRIEHELWLAGIHGERAELYRLARARKLSEEMTRRLVREVDLMEARFTSN